MSCHVIWHVRANVFSIWSSCHLAEEEVGSVEQEGGVTLICHYGLSNPGQYKSVLYPYLVGQKPGVTFICHSSWSCCEDSKLTLTLISTQFLISAHLVSTEFKLDVRIISGYVRSSSLGAIMVQLASSHLKSLK